MAHLLPNLKTTFVDSNGLPLAGGQVFSYAAGTSTPLATYTDETEGTQNTNPVVLDANGQANIWIGDAAYKFIIQDANDVVQFTTDQVAYLGPGEIVSGNIANGAVGTAALANFAVTQAKLAAKAIATQILTLASNSSVTAVVQTGTVTVATTGRPVRVGLKGIDNSGAAANFKVSAPPTTPAIGVVEILRDATKILSQSFGIESAQGNAILLEETAAGTYSFTAPFTGPLRFRGCGAGGSGGAGSGTFGGGGGGGSGERETLVSVVAGVAYNIIVGAGGAAPPSNTDGNDGGNTIVERASDGAILLMYLGGKGGKKGVSGGALGGLGANGGGNGGNGGATTSSNGLNGTDADKRTFGGGKGGLGGTNNSIDSGGGGGGGGMGHTIGGNTTTGGIDGASPGNGCGGNGGGLTNGAGGSTAGGAGDRGSGGGGGTPTGAAAVGGDGYLEIVQEGARTGTIVAYVPASAFQVIDNAPTAATHNYTMQMFVTNAGATIDSTGIISLEVYEL